MMKITCEDCHDTVYLSQTGTCHNPTGICSCGQGYYAYWSIEGVQIRKVDAKLLIPHNSQRYNASLHI